MTVTLPANSDGYVGRRCPAADCHGYFKITPGTGSPTVEHCICAYCGHRGSALDFATEDQRAHVMSVAKNEIIDIFQAKLDEMLHRVARESRGLATYTPSASRPTRQAPVLEEPSVETPLVCAGCSLAYAIFGAFAFCPDCGQHNSLQILDANLGLAQRMCSAADVVDPSLHAAMIENALEDGVSSFDGFGRETCRVHAERLGASLPSKLSFQSLPGARKNVQQAFGFDLAAGVSANEWEFAVRCFQRRHLLGHAMGVVDAKYVAETQDPEAVVGRKIKITSDDVSRLAAILRMLAKHLIESMPR